MGSIPTGLTIEDYFLGLLLLTFGLTVGGCLIDLNYVKRKFRVILKLNSLMEAIYTSSKNYEAIDINLIKVAGDDTKASYNSKGYRQAVRCGLFVYISPLFSLIAIYIIFIVR